jgi:hypothetical protein
VSRELRESVRFELGQLERLLREYGDALDAVASGKVDRNLKLAAGGALHAFYNGVEGLFKRIGDLVDGRHDHGAQWHRELLDAMAVPASRRPAAISAELHDTLEEYLRFRHRFRHSYSFDLDVAEMAPLARDCDQVLTRLTDEMNAFLASLGTSG